jgi:hypothetical protein
MKLLVSILITIALGAGSGWAIVTVQQAESGEHFVPDNSLNPAVSLDEAILSTAERSQVEVLNGEHYVFGTMLRGQTKTRRFDVRNRGGKPLELELGETTCKCTFVTDGFNEEKKAVVQPGETLAIELSWKPIRYELGFHQSAELLTNDPERRKLLLSVGGNVNQVLRASPDELKVPNMVSDKGATLEGMLFCSLDDGEWKIIGERFEIEDTAHFFELEYGELTADEVSLEPQAKSGKKVLIHIKPGYPIGPLRQMVNLTTDCDAEPDLYFRIEGNVVSDISIVGRHFDSVKNVYHMPAVDGVVGGESILQMIVKGENHADIEFEIDKIDPEGVMVVEFGEKSSSERITRIPLIIRIPPGTPSVSRLGQLDDYAWIYIKTSHDVKEVKLAVQMVVK